MSQVQGVNCGRTPSVSPGGITGMGRSCWVVRCEPGVRARGGVVISFFNGGAWVFPSEKGALGNIAARFEYDDGVCKNVGNLSKFKGSINLSTTNKIHWTKNIGQKTLDLCRC